jgi:hypothetical protein
MLHKYGLDKSDYDNYELDSGLHFSDDINYHHDPGINFNSTDPTDWVQFAIDDGAWDYLFFPSGKKIWDAPAKRLKTKVTNAEKEMLEASLPWLPHDQIMHVINMIKSRAPTAFELLDDEVNIDFNEMDDETLGSIITYVNGLDFHTVSLDDHFFNPDNRDIDGRVYIADPLGVTVLNLPPDADKIWAALKAMGNDIEQHL